MEEGGREAVGVQLSGRLSEFLSSESVREDEWIKQGKKTKGSTGEKMDWMKKPRQKESGRFEGEGEAVGKVKTTKKVDQYKYSE